MKTKKMWCAVIFAVMYLVQMISPYSFNPVAVSAAETVPAFENGDTVVFVGDSITHYGSFHRVISEYYKLHYPDYNINVLNCGVSGDTAGGALARLEEDVLAKSPNRAVVMFGMNDLGRGNYTTAEPDENELAKRENAMQKYQDNMQSVVTKLREANITVYLMGPTPFDENVTSNSANAPGYDMALVTAGEYLKNLAEETEGCYFVDLHAPLAKANAQIQQLSKAQTIIGNDRIHPGDLGHMLMAYTFLKAQGMSNTVASLNVSAANMQINTVNASVTEQVKTRDGVFFNYKPGSLPLWNSSVYKSLESYVDITENLNKETLFVSGLENDTYIVKIDKTVLGYYTAAQLAAGINISVSEGNPNQTAAETVSKLYEEKRAAEVKLRDRVMIDILMEKEGLDPSSAEDVKAYRDSVLNDIAPGSYDFNKTRLDNAEYARENEAEILSLMAQKQASIDAAAVSAQSRIMIYPKSVKNPVLFEEKFSYEKGKVPSHLKPTNGASSNSAIVDAPGGGDGTALKLSTTAAEGNSTATVTVPVPAQKDSFYIQAKVFVPATLTGTDTPNSKSMWFRLYEDAKWPYGAAFYAGKDRAAIWNGTNSVGGLKSSTWHTVGAYVNMANNTYDFYVNGSKANSEPVPFRAFSNGSKHQYINQIMIDDATEAKNSEGYIDNLEIYESVPVMPLIDENFESTNIGGVPSGWTKTPAASSVEVEWEDEEKQDNKVLHITTSKDITQNINITRSFTRQTGLFSFEMDYLIKDNIQQGLAVYLIGSHGNDVVLEMRQTTLTALRTINGVTTYPVVKNGISAGKWHRLKLLLNVPENNMQIWLDEEYQGAFDMRFAPEIEWLQTVNIGAMGSNSPSVFNMWVDNIKIEQAEESGDRILQEIRSLPFDDLAEGESPSGWKISNSAHGTAGAVVRTGSNKAYKITSTTSDTFTINSTIAEDGRKLQNGYYEFSFDYNLDEVNDKYLQFYLMDGSTFALSLGIHKNRIISMLSATANDRIANVSTPGWHNLRLLIDMNEKVYYSYLDGVDTGNVYYLRNTAVNALSHQYFALSGGTGGIGQIDNYVVNQDMTDYGSLNIELPAPAQVDTVTDVIYNAPYGMAADLFVKTITMKTKGAVASVVGKDGAVKTTEGIDGGDLLVVTNPGTPAKRTYTIAQKLECSVVSLKIDDEEFADAKTITRGGTADGIMMLTSNLEGTIKPNIIIAAYDDNGKLSGVNAYKPELVNRTATRVDFTLDIPAGQKNGKFCIFIWQENSMSPYSDVVSKQIISERSLSLPHVFSDNMVLQRGQKVNVFGEGSEGSTVTVTFGEQVKDTVVTNGRWILQLDEMNANNVGQELIVSMGDEEKKFSNVRVGDVFYGGGQSNMQRTMSSVVTTTPASVPADTYLFVSALTSDPSVRIDNPASLKESWGQVTTSNAGNCPAVMYYLAETLRKENVDVPIGLVVCCWGGTSIDHWMRSESFLDESGFENQTKRYLERTTTANGMRVSSLYDAMARSIIPFNFSGMVWYQGESDVGRPYELFLKNMIDDYRVQWDSDIPFYIIQLPGYNNTSWPAMRLRQWAVRDVADGIHVVVTNNTGDPDDIHPIDKDIVGDYLGRMVLNKQYDKKIPYSGPVYSSMNVGDNNITLHFDFVNDGIHGGLSTFEGTLPGFEICGEDGIYKAATAQIAGDTVVVSGVDSPKHVRYGYQSLPLKSLCNDSNGIKLPAAPFRTDGVY